MFFLLSKVAFFVLAPLNACVIAIAVGGALLWFGVARVVTGWMIGVGTAGLIAFSFLPVGTLLIAPLEARFPAVPPPQAGQYSGIILLGGFENTRLSGAHGALNLRASAERFTETARLGRRLPDIPILFTGGAAGFWPGDTSAGRRVRRYLSELGIAPARVLIEETSRNTWENARYSQPLLKGDETKPYLLVTSAWHMPRAIGVFRKAGINVAPWPVDHRAPRAGELWRPPAEAVVGLGTATIAVKEWLGLVVYWMTGRSAALWPGPGAPGPAAATGPASQSKAGMPNAIAGSRERP